MVQAARNGIDDLSNGAGERCPNRRDRTEIDYSERGPPTQGEIALSPLRPVCYPGERPTWQDKDRSLPITSGLRQGARLGSAGETHKMKRPGKWTVLALVVAGVAVASRVVISQQPAAVPPVVANLYGELFEKARPHLEAVLGSPLEITPRFSTATPPQLQRVPDPDLDAHLHWHFAHLQSDTLERTRQVARQIAVSATVAQYVEGKDAIVVVPDNLEKIAAWDESLAPAKTEAFVQLALVCEVVRHQLDHRYHLAQLRADCHDAEEYHALQAVIEGRTQDLTLRVAEKLGSQALFPLLAQRYAHVPDEAPDPSLRAVSQTYLQYLNRACAQGVSFWSALDQAGVHEECAFTRRPRQLTMVARPEAWIRAWEANRPDLAGVLQPLESALPAAEWQSAQQTWTPVMLAQVAGLLGTPRERVDKIAATWDEGRTLLWVQRSHPDRQVALSAVRHENAAGARAYFGFAVDLQRKQDTLPPDTCGPSIRVIESKSTSVHLEGCDEAVRNDKQIQFSGAPVVLVSLLLARSGDLVIECTWHGATADADLAERLVQAVRKGGH
jgi:hypothetical protein